jgi:hypothetical protein
MEVVIHGSCIGIGCHVENDSHYGLLQLQTYFGTRLVKTALLPCDGECCLS